MAARAVAENLIMKATGKDRSKLMKKLAIALSLLLIPSCFAESGTSKAIAAFNPVDTERWQQVYKTNLGILYFDKQTVKKEILPIVRQPGQGPSVQYTFWVKSFKRSGEISEPVQTTMRCITREEITPESVQERLYNYFCNSPDAQQTVYIAPPNPYEVEQKAMAQQLRENRRAVLEQQANSQRQTAIYSALPIFSMLPMAFRGR